MSGDLQDVPTHQDKTSDKNQNTFQSSFLWPYLSPILSDMVKFKIFIIVENDKFDYYILKEA